jgi:sec-independent protein translocase protein TatA
VFGIGPSEFVVIVIVAVLLLFGGKKIPELMRGLGRGIHEFKKGARGIDDDEKEEPKKIDTNKS